MANVDIANGFSPFTSDSGKGQPVESTYTLSATNSEIGKGTPVKIAAGGVDLASPGDALLGIAAEYKAANAGGSIKVWDDPAQKFAAQTDNGTGTATAATDVGKNANFVGTGVGTTKLSQAELDEDSADTTATLQFKLLYLEPGPKNEAGEFNRWVVVINNHILKGGTGTAGV